MNLGLIQINHKNHSSDSFNQVNHNSDVFHQLGPFSHMHRTYINFKPSINSKSFILLVSSGYPVTIAVAAMRQSGMDITVWPVTCLCIRSAAFKEICGFRGVTH